jgi:hypothetical protein
MIVGWTKEWATACDLNATVSLGSKVEKKQLKELVLLLT